MNGRRVGDTADRIVISHIDITERQHYEVSLRVAHNRLEAAVNASQVVLFHQDLDLRYTWIHNPVLGFAAQEILGKRDNDLFPRVEDSAAPRRSNAGLLKLDSLTERKYVSSMTGNPVISTWSSSRTATSKGISLE